MNQDEYQRAVVTRIAELEKQAIRKLILDAEAAGLDHVEVPTFQMNITHSVDHNSLRVTITPVAPYLRCALKDLIKGDW